MAVVLCVCVCVNVGGPSLSLSVATAYTRITPHSFLRERRQGQCNSPDVAGRYQFAPRGGGGSRVGGAGGYRAIHTQITEREGEGNPMDQRRNARGRGGVSGDKHIANTHHPVHTNMHASSYKSA
jgi:hypothetical protein